LWWRNGLETARQKYAPLWTSGHILWAAAARTNVPSLGRSSAVSLSKMQFCEGQLWKILPLQLAYRHAYSRTCSCRSTAIPS
jgi:hypothetical protein